MTRLPALWALSILLACSGHASAQALQGECLPGPPATASGPPVLWVTQATVAAPSLAPRFRVWAQCAPLARFDAAAQADVAAAAAVVESLWGPMTAVMGPPLPDAAGPDEGGDSAIDFYLLAPGQSVYRNGEAREIVGVIAQVQASEPRNTPTASGYVLLGRQDIRKAAFRGFVAHEFFHVLQNAHNLDTTLRGDDYHWFVEASAMWAQTYFDRPSAATYVHPAFVDYFQPASESLHSVDVDHTYASYVWALFMEQEAGAAAIGNAWRAMASARTWDDLNDAIDAQVSFASRFRDFALRNVNDLFDGTNIIGTRYVDQDRTFPDGTRPVTSVAATIEAPGGSASPSFPVVLPSLTAVYHSYSFGGVGEVTFTFDGLQPSGDLHIDALVKIDGAWEPRPRRLSGGGRLHFCLDKPEEQVEQVYLVLSNQQKREQGRIQGSVDVEAKSEPCEDEEEDPLSDSEWHGTVKVVTTFSLDENSLGMCQDRNPLSGAPLPAYPCGARQISYARKSFSYAVQGLTSTVTEAQYRERYLAETCSPQNDPRREQSICKVNFDLSQTTNVEEEAGTAGVGESGLGDGTFEIAAGSMSANSPGPDDRGVLAGSDVQSPAPGITYVITWSLTRRAISPPPPPDPCVVAPAACAPPPEHRPFTGEPPQSRP